MKQFDIANAPAIWFEQEANLFDVSLYNNSVYMYDLSKRLVVDPNTLDPTTYTIVSIDPLTDPTWRELAWTYLQGRTDAWWLILIFNGIQDATLFPADLSPDGITAVDLKIPTESTTDSFLRDIRTL